LQSVVEEAARLCRADVADIAVRDGSVYRMSPFTGFPAEFQALVSGTGHHHGGGTVIARAIRDARVVQIVDVLADPDFIDSEVQRAGRFRPAPGVPVRHHEEPG